MQTKLSTVADFLTWANGQGEFVATLHTHRIQKSGYRERLGLRSRRNGQPCPYHEVVVKSQQEVRLNTPIKPRTPIRPGDLELYHEIDPRWPLLIVVDVRSQVRYLTYLPTTTHKVNSYFFEDRQLDFKRDLIDFWVVSKPPRKPVNPTIHRSYMTLASLDKVSVTTQWELIPD